MWSARIWAVLAAPLLLTGCLLSPGTFVSSLDIEANGDFTFRYKGELLLTDMSNPGAGEEAPFEPFPCYDENTFEDRECTAAEIDAQRTEYEERRQSAQMPDAMTMPGMPDLESDVGIAEFVAMLNKQKGFESAVYRGDRIIDVAYVISGNLNSGFSFPMADNMPGIFAFVTIIPRKDGSVKITAPAYVNSDNSANPMGAMGAMMGGAMAAADDSAKAAPAKQFAKGSFTIRTTGQVLTNNTEEGAEMQGGTSTLTWNITERSAVVPEALVRFAP